MVRLPAHADRGASNTSGGWGRQFTLAASPLRPNRGLSLLQRLARQVWYTETTGLDHKVRRDALAASARQVPVFRAHVCYRSLLNRW